jgi:lipopolysaccharide/colanic/teichoic acid biosynthesis glycosyltransferase
MVSMAYERDREVGGPGRPHFDRLVLALAFALPLVVAVLVYGGLYLGTPNPLQLHPQDRLHILTNLACAYTVLIFAARVHGHLDRKLTQTVMVALLVNGVLAFLILSGRWYFSRPILLTNFAVTMMLAIGLVLARHRIGGPRVAFIRPLAESSAPSRHFGDLVTSPTVDLTRYDVVLVAFTGGISVEWARALSRAMLAGCQVRHVGEYVEDVRGSVALEHFDLNQVSNVSLVSYRPLKRFIDVAAVIFVLPLALPIIALAALAILATMGGPAFFVQERVGLGGQRFRMWKLRTMRQSPPGEAQRAATPGDARITRVGALLRRFRIDELPQLWNVLKGEMSLIGPRPEAVPFHEEYVRALPMYAYRNLVRPGITGWAQVCAPPSANADEARRKLTYDLFYVKRMGLFLDLQILLRTIWTVTHGAGVR